MAQMLLLGGAVAKFFNYALTIKKNFAAVLKKSKESNEHNKYYFLYIHVFIIKYFESR